GAGSTTRIPVSCAEQGRWRSISTKFSSAPHITNTELRRRKAAALPATTRARGRRQAAARQARPLARGSAQDEVWETIRGHAERLGATSPTGAHRDLFLARERELEALQPAVHDRP